MNLNKYKRFTEKLYSDKFTIYRYIEIENNDGSTGEEIDTNPSLINIPCKISTVKEDEHKLNQEDVNKELVKFKIFCSPDVEIFKGDTVIAEKIINGKSVDTIKAIASKPVKYNINQEFSLIESGEA